MELEIKRKAVRPTATTMCLRKKLMSSKKQRSVTQVSSASIIATEEALNKIGEQQLFENNIEEIDFQSENNSLGSDLEKSFSYNSDKSLELNIDNNDYEVQRQI